MGIRDLPLEILAQICRELRWQTHPDYKDSNIQRKDIRSVRLVSREFAAAALPLLLKKVHFGQYNTSLETLQAVSEHNVLRHYVRTISCDDSLLAPVHLHDKAWREDWISCASLPDKYNEESMKDAQLRYKEIYDQMTKIIEEDEDSEVLNAALVRLPGVDKIIISDLFVSDESEDICHKQILRKFLSAKHRTYEPPEESLWDRASTPYRSFVTVVRALSMTEHRIRAVYISGEYSGVSHRMFSSAAPKDFDAMCNLFRNLTYLYLDINTHGNEELWEDDTGSQDALYRLLSTANLLKTLLLGSMYDFEEGVAPSTLKVSSCFGSFKWPSLRSLSLEGWTVLAEDLFGLLHRHRDTIKRIYFDDIHLEGRTWGQLLDGIRDESAVMWTQADCERLSDAAGWDYSATEGEVTAFLREERDNPLTDYWEQREEE